MGYSTYNYFGAYIEMPEVEKEYKQKIRRCSNTECKNHSNENMPSNSQFCSKCGSKIEELEEKRTKISMLDYYNFAEKHNLNPELFSQVQIDRNVLIPNYNFGSVNSWSNDEEIVEEFVWGYSRKAIVEYTQHAQGFIDKVKEVYGIELKVKFGIVSYNM